MPRIPAVNHLRAVRAFEKAGFRIRRQSKHIIMSNGNVTIVIPRNNPVDANLMGQLVADSGLSVQEFRELI
jgi:glutamine cyclotransferase